MKRTKGQCGHLGVPVIWAMSLLWGSTKVQRLYRGISFMNL